LLERTAVTIQQVGTRSCESRPGRNEMQSRCAKRNADFAEPEDPYNK